jgi:hypothetical protein
MSTDEHESRDLGLGMVGHEGVVRHEGPGDIAHPRQSPFDRRRFLALTGATAASGVILAACTSSGAGNGHGKGGSGASGSGSTGTTPRVPVDIQVAGLAASVEIVAVTTYRVGIGLARRGALGKVPSAFEAFAATAETQHRDHANAWNAILSAAGYTRVTRPDPVLRKVVHAELARVSDVESLARLALTLEAVAAATCLDGLKSLSAPHAIATAASIQPVEMQHVAVLKFLFGIYPVASAFASTRGARPPTDYPITRKAIL